MKPNHISIKDLPIRLQKNNTHHATSRESPSELRRQQGIELIDQTGTRQGISYTLSYTDA